MLGLFFYLETNMATIDVILSSLRRAEKQLVQQLGSVRSAMSSLTGTGKTKDTTRRKRSAATRAKMAAAQKKRWAKKKRNKD